MATDPTPQQVRAGKIAGLRELADLLEQHPEVPVPGIESVSNIELHIGTLAALVAFIGDDDVTITGSELTYRIVRRRFAGLIVRAYVRVELVADPAPRVLTLDEIRARAAEASSEVAA